VVGITTVAVIGIGLAVPINDTTHRIIGAQALQRMMLADASGRQLPITVVRNGALVDLIVRGEVADRRVAAEDYERAGRVDVAARLTAAADVLAAHLAVNPT
jgi:hypothetical protein